jgi:Domain of unknown function (DUF6265)
MNLKTRVLAVCLLTVGAAWAQEPTAPAPTITGLSWIAGCWEGGGGDTQYQEQWMRPNGKTMLGMSRTVRNDTTLSFEFLRIHQEADGIYLTSIPSGQVEASFKLVKVEGQKVEFKNPDHDFPQKIIYELGKNGDLKATISGHNKGAYQKVEFPMLKAKCD